MSARTIYHVLPHDHGWQIKARGGSRAISLHKTKAAAVSAARILGINKAPSQIVVHRSDGTIAEERTYERAELNEKKRRSQAARKAAATRKRKQERAAQVRSAAAKRAASRRRHSAG